MKHLIVVMVLLCVIPCKGLQGETKPRSIYTGGMLVFQPGITLTSNPFQSIHASSSSVGGILRFYFGDLLTAGIFGGSQQAGYNTAGSENSYVSFGYGGPFVGMSTRQGKFRYTLSAFAGRGTLKNLHIESEWNNSLSEASFFEHSMMVFSPIVSVDYAITARISLTIQAICLYGRLPENREFWNPTLQLGVLINR